MASFTVGSAVKCDLLNNSHIIAGKKGILNEVSRITVGEVPDLPKWLHGGELVLSTLYAFKDDPTLLKSFIKGLINANAAGLGIKTTRFLKKLDPSIINLSNKNNFPIIDIQQNIRWSDLIQKLYEMMLAEKIQIETEMRLKGDLLDELLAENIKTDDELIKRASFLGYDVSQGCSVIIVDIDNFRALIKKIPTEQKIQYLKEEFYNYISHLVKPLTSNSLIIPREDSLIIFAASDEGNKIDPYFVAKNVIINCRERYDNFSVSVGISRFHEKPLDMIRAYEEAALSIKANSKIGKPGSIMHFDRLGSYKLLLKLSETNPEELENFYKETIAPLIKYDKEHNSDLVKTLETFLVKEQSIADAANEMYLHRHTVRYRLSRIKDITGLDIHQAEDRERLSLGLKALRLIKTKTIV